jgi:hypothetical protein
VPDFKSRNFYSDRGLMADLVFQRRRGTPQSGAGQVRYALHVVRGSERILAMREMLIAFSELCGQPGTMDDLSYFLSKPGLLTRIPCLFLVVKRANLKLEELVVGDLLGAVFLYEFSVMGCGIRAFATNDRSGRGTMLALPEQRLKVASIASRVLLDRGAHIVMLSFRAAGEEAEKEDILGLGIVPSSRITADWAWRERQIAAYLPLENGYEATLATLGRKTRVNMRYYRRRAEAQLGCRFIPEVMLTPEDFVQFNRECMYRVSDRVALWRLKTMQDLREPVLMGMKDSDGRWLALLGGRRYRDRTEVLWQVNRDGYSTHSLSSVMRSHCIEHEIERGMKRLYFEGGTAHSISHAFVREELVDLVAVRRSPVAWVMKKVARRRVSPDNELADVLRDPETVWLPC